MRQIESDKNGNANTFTQKGKKIEMDKCVSCGRETDYPKNMHIDYRSYYVEGAGQLCKDCHNKVYNLKNI